MPLPLIAIGAGGAAVKAGNSLIKGAKGIGNSISRLFGGGKRKGGSFITSGVTYSRYPSINKWANDVDWRDDHKREGVRVAEAAVRSGINNASNFQKITPSNNGMSLGHAIDQAIREERSSTRTFAESPNRKPEVNRIPITLGRATTKEPAFKRSISTVKPTEAEVTRVNSEVRSGDGKPGALSSKMTLIIGGIVAAVVTIVALIFRPRKRRR